MAKDVDPGDVKILEWDEEFKTVITRKKILAWIVKLTIPRFRDVDVDTIAAGIRSDGERHVKMENTVMRERGGSTSILDSVFEMDIEVDGQIIPILVGIEHQNDPEPGYSLEVRVQYYAAKMLGRQRHKDYHGLRQSFSVWLLPDPLAHDRGKVDFLTMGKCTGDEGISPLDDSMVNAVAVHLGTEGEDTENILDFLSVFFVEGCRAHTREGFEAFMKRYKLDEDDLTLNEVEELSSLFQDSKVRYTREAKAESNVNHVFLVVNNGKHTVEEALNMLEIPDNEREHVRSEVLKRLQHRGI